MVAVIDDVVLLPLSFAGVEPLPNILMMSFNALHRHALEEVYPLEKIQDAIKENRMGFELGELNEKEYAKMAAELAEKLKIARRVREMTPKASTNILNL